MQQYILIENKGKIDLAALSLMGGSTKREDTSKIGRFGSGNKYSLAVLLRDKIEFKIFSGLEPVEVVTKPVEFRGVQFDQVYINGRETSLTAQMGPDWETWAVIRELVSNSRDEPNSNVITSTEIIEPKEGYTRFYIGHSPEIVEVVNNWDRYFTFDRIDVLIEHTEGKVFPNTGCGNEDLYMFKRGIRCYTGATKAIYQYDMAAFTINESRVLDNTYGASNECARYLCAHATKEVATNILRNAFKGENKYFEADLNWYYYGSHPMNSTWSEAIGNRAIVVADVSGFFMHIIQSKPYYLVSKEMARAIHKNFPDIPVYGLADGSDELISKPAEKTPKIEYMLKKVLEFMAEIKYTVTADIEIVEFNSHDILGNASKGYIELSSRLFDMGMKEVAMCIMEETEHIITGHADETRALQDHLFRMVLTEKEERWGVFL